MRVQQKLMRELEAIGLAALYFGSWLAVLLLIKYLILAEYRIEISDMSKALIGALVLSKVVIVLEHVPLGAWVRARPGWVDVILRTALYGLGVLIVLLLEKAFEGRHGYDGYGAALIGVLQQADIYHVYTNVIVLSGALLSYNMLSVVRKRLGKGELLRMFLTPLPEEGSEDFKI